MLKKIKYVNVCFVSEIYSFFQYYLNYYDAIKREKIAINNRHIDERNREYKVELLYFKQKSFKF